MNSSANNTWLEQRSREVQASIAAIQKLRDQLDYLQIGWRPPEGGWSIGQVFEHLILTDAPYLTTIPNVLARARAGGAEWKPSFLGGLITRAVEPQAPRKAKAARGFQPGPEPRARVIDEYLAIRRALLPLIERSRGIDLNRTRLNSPVLKIARYNLGDAFMILTRHTQRHLQQIERIKAHAQFPSQKDNSGS